MAQPFTPSNLPPESQKWRREVEARQQAAEDALGFGTTGTSFTASAGIEADDGTATAADSTSSGASPSPDAVDDLTLTPSTYLDSAGQVHGRVDLAFTPVGTSTDEDGVETPVGVDSYEVWARVHTDASDGTQVGSPVYYVADSGNHVIRKVDAAGNVTTYAGTGVAGYADGAAASAQFDTPRGIAVDGDGNVYVADSGNYVIRKIDQSGNVSTLAGTPGTPGSITLTGLNLLTMGWDGNLYLAETGNDECHVTQITLAGVLTRVSGNYVATGIFFDGAMGVAADADGRVFTSISGTPVWSNPTDPAGYSGYVNGIYEYDPTAASPSWMKETGPLAPGGDPKDDTDGVGNAATILRPRGVEPDGAFENLFISQISGGLRKYEIATGTVSTVNPAAGISLRGLAVDPSGNIIAVDYGANEIITITPGGTVSLLAGSGSSGSSDGAGAAASFNEPYGITMHFEDISVDDDGNVTGTPAEPPNTFQLVGVGQADPFGVELDLDTEYDIIVRAVATDGTHGNFSDQQQVTVGTDSVALTGTPTAPTASPGDDSETIATTAYADAAAQAVLPGVMVSGTPSAGDVLTATSATSADWETPASGGTVYRDAVFSYGGTLVTVTGTQRLYNRSGVARTIAAVDASVGTPPTGASVIVDVLKNGTTIFTTTANRPTIAAGTNEDVSGTPDVASWADGDYLTVSITQVGSTSAGADLTAVVIYS